MYYIYAYLRENGTPYYIGKGKGHRAWNKHKNEVNKPGKNLIVIMETNLTEIGALALERFYIRWYGRKDIGTGVLRNRTDGGEGRSNSPISEHHKQRVAESNRTRKISESHRRKIIESNKRRVLSEETKQKISEAKRGSKYGPQSKEHVEKRIQSKMKTKVC